MLRENPLALLLLKSTLKTKETNSCANSQGPERGLYCVRWSVRYIVDSGRRIDSLLWYRDLLKSFFLFLPSGLWLYAGFLNHPPAKRNSVWQCIKAWEIQIELQREKEREIEKAVALDWDYHLGLSEALSSFNILCQCVDGRCYISNLRSGGLYNI